MTPLRRRRQTVALPLRILLLAIPLSLLSACQADSEAPDDAAVADLALNADLPYGVDVTGEEMTITTLEAGVSLSDLLEGKQVAVLSTFDAVSREEGLPGSACDDEGQCRQVEIYNYTDSTTIVATVDVETDAVLDVHVLSEASPALGDAQTELVRDLIDASDLVASELEGRGYAITMGPVATRQDEGPCATHWCVLASLTPDEAEQVDGIEDRLLVFVDLDDEQVVDAFWRSTLRREGGQ